MVAKPRSHPLITCCCPIVNLNGWLRLREESEGRREEKRREVRRSMERRQTKPLFPPPLASLSPSIFLSVSPFPLLPPSFSTLSASIAHTELRAVAFERARVMCHHLIPRRRRLALAFLQDLLCLDNKRKDSDRHMRVFTSLSFSCCQFRFWDQPSPLSYPPYPFPTRCMKYLFQQSSVPAHVDPFPIRSGSSHVR